MRVGVLSDTHGLLRNEIYGVFEGVHHIVHAGDVGDPAILTELEVIAPLTAVAGNVDGWAAGTALRDEAHVRLVGAQVAVVHGHRWGSPKVSHLIAAFPNADVIVYGHTHRALCERHGDRLLLNPGSAGAARFGHAVTAALLTLEPGRRPEARIVTLLPGKDGPRR
ncbi:MAG: metallophosphoesterase family protein [Gemmatimonadota bacterium]